MVSAVISSWGNVIHAPHELFRLSSRYDGFPTAPSLLPFGNGRSYGDSCLNVGGALLQMRSLDRFISFDRETGVLACEAGVLLSEILDLVVPAGWFLPAVPGTCYVTVGGAIANDVHGKNHHQAGTFGCHVRRLELLRSNGDRLLCSLSDNPDWFAATVGGLGLTGVVTWAELQLRRIPGPRLAAESIRFHDLAEFFSLSDESERDFEYTVSWIDCLGRGKYLGRGLFQRANHSAGSPESVRQLGVPFPLPFSAVNAVSLRAFNTLYYHKQWSRLKRTSEYYRSFFFPLDGILHWNRLYGPRGFYQYQCVIPTPAAHEATAALLDTIARSGQGSFLAVLKQFGTVPSPGMLSFPRPGVTLALDFPNKGARLERLFEALDRIVSGAGGTLYPAKDGRMPGELFRSGYPRWQEFSQYIDPACSSSFWRRVTEHT
jgi:FAD/FMN-containing dehydrogenase